MIKIDDYTQLPIGTKVAKGEIQDCPHCKRRGLKETVNGKDFYTHSQWAGFNEEGHPELGWVMCPKQEIPVKTTPR